MASNDYYTGFGKQDTSYHGGRQDAPLPPIPQPPSHTPSNPYAQNAPSPVHSPFEDHAYPAYPPPSNSYHGHSGSGYSDRYDDPSSRPHAQQGMQGYSYSSSDPFADQNAIPLQQNSSTQKLNAPPSPTLAMGEAEQQYSRKDRTSHRKRDGWFKGKITWAVYVLTLVQISVFIAEIVRNAQLTGSPIAIKPSFNPMIGPSPGVLILMGARYVPCMRQYDLDDQNTGLANPTLANPEVHLMCPEATVLEANCTLAQVCGFGIDLTPRPDGTQPQPNQWFRFITPIFLHGGLVHIAFNMLLQLTLGRDMEKQIGTLRFLLIYFSAGIFGFVFGANFAPAGLSSTGCSGALFGILAVVLLDLLYSWKTRKSPGRDLAFILLDIAIAFVIGLLPALDNFSHIGGFLTGLVLGVCILHSPDALRERIGLDEPPYSTVTHDGTPNTTGVQSFVRAPVGFFKGRKPLWWAWWLLRVGALVAVLVSFIVLLRNFYVYKTTCSWCKYLSCLPIKNWCDIGVLKFTKTSAKIKVRMTKFGFERF